MKNKKAFTLIELLVVVLIIGILAAIAVPQYQKAVKKSRAVEAISNLRALMNAQEIFHLANGTYTTNLDNLDIKLDSSTYTYFCLTNGNDIVYCYARPKNTDEYYFQHIGTALHCIGTQQTCSFISNRNAPYGEQYWVIDL